LRPLLLPLGGAVHLALVVTALEEDSLSIFGGWLELDPVGKIVLGLVSVLCGLAMLVLFWT